jgi:Ca2+-binding RTX toxin-like protein
MSTLFINSITDNNIISSAEAQIGFNITGAGQAGATVRLTFDSGRELAGGNTTVVNQNSQWSVPVVAADIKALGQGMQRVTATQTLGNTSLQTFRTFRVDAVLIDVDDPIIDLITDTAIINAAATGTSLTVTGTGKPGATLILGFTSGLTLTGNNTTIVRGDGTWFVDIAVADIFIFAQGGEVLTATQIDGESISLPTTQPLLNNSGFTRIFGAGDDDELFAPNTGNAQVFGLQGNDILDATPSPEQVILYGAPGNDRLIAGNNHTLYGGDGDDTLSAAGSIGRNILYGEAGNDLLIVVEGSHNEVYGGEDKDRLRISDGSGFNRLYGEEGDDILDASSDTGNNQLFGGEGDDRLIAGAATDELFGGEGDDHLFAGNGGILTGDGGANTFYLANGSIPSELAIITDFQPGVDRLVVAGLPDLTVVKLIRENTDTIVIAVLSDTDVSLALLQGIQPSALVAGRDVFSQTESLLEPINLVGETFKVTNLEQNPSGFVLTFNDDLNLSVLNLYRGIDPNNTGAPVTDSPDLILTDSAGNIINGSLIWDQGNANTLTFVKTGDILAPGNYTLTLESRSDGFVSSGDRLLDGNEDGLSGGNFVRQFTVDSPTAPVLTLPDFSRGPDQEVNIRGGGQFNPLPIRIRNPGGLENISFTLQYDPDLLAITGANVAAPGWDLESDFNTRGQAQFTLSGPALNASTDLITLNAQVPDTATYGAKGVLQILPGAGLIGDSAVQLVALLGDTTKTESYLAADASLISRVNVGLDTGFRAFPVTDPLIIGDATGNGNLDSGDVTSVRRASVGLSSPFLPQLV